MKLRNLKRTKKWLSCFLAAACILTMAPAVYAEDSNDGDPAISQQEDQGQQEDGESSDTLGNENQENHEGQTDQNGIDNEIGDQSQNTGDVSEGEPQTEKPDGQINDETEASAQNDEAAEVSEPLGGTLTDEMIAEAAIDQPSYIITGDQESRPDLYYRSGGGQKIVSVMGDSIATYQGYSSWGNYYFYYTQDHMSVNDTWWMRYIKKHNMKLGVNDSLGSSRVVWDGREQTSYLGPDKCMSSDARIKNLGKYGTPDVILFFGGTNDVSYSQVGSFQPGRTGTATFADAYNTAIIKMKQYYPNAEIICLTPYYQIYSPNSLVDQYVNVIQKVCSYYGVKCVDLRQAGLDISQDMCSPDYLHVNDKGHEKMWYMMEYGKAKMAAHGIYVAENSSTAISAGMNISPTYDGVQFQWQIYDCQKGKWTEGWDWSSSNWLTWHPQKSGWYWLHCTAKNEVGDTVSYTQSIYFKGNPRKNYIQCDGLTWVSRKDYLDVGAAYSSSDKSPLFKFSAYNVAKKQWVTIRDWAEGNWESWKTVPDTYLLYVEMKTRDGKYYDDQMIAFQYYPGNAKITGTYTGWQNHNVLLGSSSNLKDAKYEFKLYDLDKKEWFWGSKRGGQWVTWKPRKGNFWEHFELYSSDGRLLDTKTYCFAVQ